jgi:hypothetical protein
LPSFTFALGRRFRFPCPHSLASIGARTEVAAPEWASNALELGDRDVGQSGEGGHRARRRVDAEPTGQLQRQRPAQIEADLRQPGNLRLEHRDGSPQGLRLKR